MTTTAPLHRIARLFTLLVVAAAALAPASALAIPAKEGVIALPKVGVMPQTQDLRSPDAKVAVQPAAPHSDGSLLAKGHPQSAYRNATPAEPQPASPGGDAVALAQERSYSTYGEPKPFVSTPKAPVGGGSEFDLPSAGIGAGVTIAVALLALTALALSTRRRRGALLS
jgi:uncharacterized protein (TIGR03382 family)